MSIDCFATDVVGTMTLVKLTSSATGQYLVTGKIDGKDQTYHFQGDHSKTKKISDVRTDRWIGQTEKQMDRQTYRQTDRRTYRKTDKMSDRQTNNRTDSNLPFFSKYLIISLRTHRQNTDRQT